MAERTESLTLKWGTIKGWEFTEDSPAHLALKKWAGGGVAPGAMHQRNTEDQREAICEVIDLVDGEIWNDWDGVVMTPDQAKKYVMEYRR